MEVWNFCIADKDAPEHVKQAFERSETRAFGPAGFLEKDDSENWAEIQKVLRGKVARSTKLCLEMGLGNERTREDMPGVTNYIFSETAARGLYKHWVDLLVCDTWAEVQERSQTYEQELVK